MFGGGASDLRNLHATYRFLSYRVPANKKDGTGIHWQVAQATSLINITFELSRAPDTAHQGTWARIDILSAN